MISVVAEIVREVALTEIIPRFGTLKSHQIRTKTHPGDLVTDADIQAEHHLSRLLTALLPGSVVVGEESVYHDRTVLDQLSEDAPVWVIDPVDGTNNFAHGRDSFGVIVALVKKGCTVAGCIHDPIRNVTVIGEKGAGAWCEGERLSLSRPQSLETMMGSLGNRHIETVERSVQGVVRLSSAAQDYLALLLGRTHFSYYRHLLPWDHAAGILLHAEAGGFSAMTNDRQPYRPFVTDDAVLAAPDRDTWETLLPLVEPPSA
ncbi:MAG: inositol monophosphatase [Alphaproteobacteria bacterium]|nr:inositol monophosphatase [Alphaproteobacteria bacterium]MBF0128493.1 inositol monophosphatase [Alphaproteobacteria bacterium]